MSHLVRQSLTSLTLLLGLAQFTHGLPASARSMTAKDEVGTSTPAQSGQDESTAKASAHMAARKAVMKLASAKQPVAGQPISSEANLLKGAEIAQAEPLPSQTPPVDSPGVPEPGKTSPVQQTPRQALPENISVNAEQYYYNWNDKLGNRGNQLVTPFTVTYSKGNFEVGLRTAWIKSQFNGNLILDGQVIGKRKGEVSTLSDTSLSLAYSLKQSKWPVRFNLDVNVPTGKATLNGDQKNAIMDGALVQQTRFGEGWNLAPGVSVSHAISQKGVVGFGLSHIMRGKFDPNGDVVNDTINPGNETVATLQYSHSEKNWMVMTGLIYTRYGTTTRGGEDYYRSGSRFDINGSLVASPSPGHRLQLSARYFTQGKQDDVNFFSGNLEKESADSSGNSLFTNFDYSIATDKQQRGNLHVLMDYLTVQANSYDRINDLFNAGRNKFSIGLGYDYAFSRKARASLQAKYFWLNDKATPTTQQDVKANGITLFATLNYNF
jgi:hypothetical protein